MSTTEQDIWNTPLDTTGVLEADPPAPPSETVADRAHTEATDKALPEQPKSDAPVEAAGDTVAPPVDEAPKAATSSEKLDWSTAPEKFRTAYDEVKGIRKTIEEMGGEPAFEVARELVTNIDKPEEFVSVVRRYPAYYAPIRNEIVVETIDTMPDAVLGVMFGDGVTKAQIDSLLTGTRGQQPASDFDPSDIDSPNYDPLLDPNQPESVKAAFRELQELRGIKERVAPLEEKVNAFDQLKAVEREEAMQQSVAKYVDEVMGVVDQVYKDAGLELSPEEMADERAVVAYRFDNTQEGAALAAEARKLLAAGDRNSAYLLQKRIKARVEQISEGCAERRARSVVARENLQTQRLNRDLPPVVEGGGSSFGAPVELPSGNAAWDDPAMEQKWRDIAAAG